MKKLYHATCISKRDSIKNNGLEPRLSRRWDFGYTDKRVYLFGDLNNPPIDYVGNYGVDIWEVNLDENCIINDDVIALNDGYKNSYYINDPVNPDKLKLIKTID